MYELSKYKLEDVLFIDIETTRASKELELDSQEFEAWSYDRNKEGKFSNEELQALYIEKGALYPEFGKITCITLGRISKDNTFPMKSYYGPDEKQILEDFFTDIKAIRQSKPKVYLGGHAILDFDIPFITKRSIINGVKFDNIVDFSGLKPWEVFALDTKVLWKMTSFFPSSLITIATALGIKSPKDDISGKEASLLGWSDEEGVFERIARYCEKDVLTVGQIIHKLSNLPELTPVTSTPEIQEDIDILTYIYQGGAYTDEVRDKIVEVIKEMSPEDRERAYDILSACTSTAKGKITDMKKTDVTIIKKIVNGGKAPAKKKTPSKVEAEEDEPVMSTISRRKRTK